MLGLIRSVVNFCRFLSDLVWLVGKIALYVFGASWGRTAWLRFWFWNRLCRRRTVFPLDRIFLWGLRRHDAVLADLVQTSFYDKIERTKPIHRATGIGVVVGVILVSYLAASLVVTGLVLLFIIAYEE